jgi:hypothetical protein
LVIHRTALALLKLSETALLRCDFENALTVLMNFNILDHPELVLTTANTEFAVVDDDAVMHIQEKFAKLGLTTVDEIGNHIARTRSAKVLSKLRKFKLPQSLRSSDGRCQQQQQQQQQVKMGQETEVVVHFEDPPDKLRSERSARSVRSVRRRRGDLCVDVTDDADEFNDDTRVRLARLTAHIVRLDSDAADSLEALERLDPVGRVATLRLRIVAQRRDQRTRVAEHEREPVVGLDLDDGARLLREHQLALGGAHGARELGGALRHALVGRLGRAPLRLLGRRRIAFGSPSATASTSTRSCASSSLARELLSVSTASAARSTRSLNCSHLLFGTSASSAIARTSRCTALSIADKSASCAFSTARVASALAARNFSNSLRSFCSLGRAVAALRQLLLELLDRLAHRRALGLVGGVELHELALDIGQLLLHRARVVVGRLDDADHRVLLRDDALDLGERARQHLARVLRRCARPSAARSTAP